MAGELQKALERRHKAELAVGQTLKRRYPVGTELAWDRNGIHSGYVVMLGDLDGLKVRNLRSGKEYWIRAHDIVREGT